MILKILWSWSLVCTIGAMSWWWDHPVALDDERLSIGNLSVRRRPLLSKPPTTMGRLHSSWNWRDKYADKRAGGERQKSRSGANPRPIRVNFCHSAAEVKWSEGKKRARKTGRSSPDAKKRSSKDIERDGSSLCWVHKRTSFVPTVANIWNWALRRCASSPEKRKIFFQFLILRFVRIKVTNKLSSFPFKCQAKSNDDIAYKK